MPDPEIPQVRDQRPKISGLLPKNAQSLVLGGIALLMIFVIALSGHNAPKATKAVAPSPASQITDPNAAEIREYRLKIEEQARKLAAEEAALSRAKQAFDTSEPAPASGSGRLTEPATTMQHSGAGLYKDTQVRYRDSSESEPDRREHQSLFASNIALTFRQPPTITPTPVLAVPATAGDPATPKASSNSPEASGQYRLFEGTIIETVLTNRLDSSFSGPVNCLVTTNVHSHDGQKLLIPQGTRVLGEVRKLDSFGQQRLSVTFHRLIMPDGYSVSLDQFQGLDQIGATGLRDEINNHYLQVFGVSIAIGAIAGLGQATTAYGVQESAAQAYQQGVTSSLSQSALHILDRYLNVLPTFTIREGYRIKIYLSQDLVLPAFDQHPVRDDL
jgi:type IV secretion system protein TrbI